MTDILKLRDYQWQAHDAVWQNTTGFVSKQSDEPLKRPAVVLPTGGGKTVIFARLAMDWIRIRKSRVCILVHRDELVNQTLEKLSAVAPAVKVGAIRGKQDDHAERDVIVASVQTLRRPSRMARLRESGGIGLIIVDECHHATAASYRAILREFGCFDEPGTGAYAVGFTATMSRADTAQLSEIWQKVVYQRDILDMINDGFLVNVSGKLVTIDGLSLSEVAVSGGDYQVGSLSEALMSADAPEFVARAYAEHAAELPGIVFTPTVETAHAFADALKDRGISAEPVWGAMPAENRRELIAAYRAGSVQVLVNCMVLTEGFDAPRAQVAVIARPTKSAALYVQMVGRVLRPFPGKGDALVLDIVGASREHRLVTLADLTSKRVTEVREGESLMEAVQREKEARNPALRDYVVTYEDVDLFKRSRANFLQTHEGIWFIASENHVWFVWPEKEPDMYRIGHRPMEKKGGGWLNRMLTLEQAMAWCETEALESSMAMAVRRDASWRKKREAPSEFQLRAARRYGVKVPDGVTKRELSDMINVARVSRFLDAPLRKKRGK